MKRNSGRNGACDILPGQHKPTSVRTQLVRHRGKGTTIRQREWKMREWVMATWVMAKHDRQRAARSL
jgi:hypothetical protein